MTTTIHSAVCNSTRSIKIGTTLPDQDRVVVQGDFSGNPVEVTRTEFLAAVAAELDVIVIPRADLPEVTVWDDTSVRVHNVVYTTDHKGDYRADALARLAVAEYLEQHPPVDEAQVKQVRSLLGAIHEFADSDALDLLARGLVSRGVTVKEA